MNDNNAFEGLNIPPGGPVFAVSGLTIHDHFLVKTPKGGNAV
jgi:hypothetical protein